jgi:hypothetical protein
VNKREEMIKFHRQSIEDTWNIEHHKQPDIWTIDIEAYAVAYADYALWKESAEAQCYFRDLEMETD